MFQKLKLTFFREDLLSSMSLFLISLPLTAGIAAASKVPPEAGLISAILGAILFGLFSSTPLTVVGPAAGLSVFIAFGAKTLGTFNYLPVAIIIAGVILILVSRLNIYKVIYVIPNGVVRGMAAGIGTILVLNMIPHLLGHDALSLVNFNLHNEDATPLHEIIKALNHFHPTALFISVLSCLLIYLFSKESIKRFIPNRISFAFLVVIVGVLVNQLLLHLRVGD